MTIYASTKALFEAAFDKAADALVKGDTAKYLAIRETLLNCYNSAIDCNERATEERIKLLNMTPPKPPIICAKCAKELD